MEKPTYVKGNSFLNTFASSCDNEDIASTGRDHLPKLVYYSRLGYK